MSDIDLYVEDILRKEGGYVNHPNDKGGPTNYGITQRTLSGYLGRPASIKEVKNLTVETAKEIYLASYFYKPRINGFPEAIQHVCLDMSVNHGPRNTVRMVQRTLAKSALVQIEVDGVAGPNTFKAAKKVYDEMGAYLINAIVDERIIFYEAIVQRNPSQSVFLKGWLRRARSFYVEVV